MSNNEDEGFFEPPIQTFMQALAKEDSKNGIKRQSFKVKPVLSAHHQINLYQYPRQLDEIYLIPTSAISAPQEKHYLDVLEKSEENLIALSEYFPRNLQCVYNKFQEKLAFKLIIRNISRQTRDEQLNTFTSTREEQKQSLTFSSNFQCGNLHFVFKQNKREVYYLLLQNDINTRGFNFWFYFNIRSLKRQRASFIIVNLSRFVKFEGQASIINYSYRKKQFERKIGFVTAVSKFCRCDNQQSYWSLLFEYEFEQQSDTYFCLALPYSYSKMIKLVKNLESASSHAKNIIENAAKSPLGNIIPSINIFTKGFYKKTIFITARQHPCETVGSFVCEAIIKKLCQKSALSQALLQRFRFLIIPMMNVDGVIHGNSRTNLTGYDLNRSWDRTGIIQSSECEQIWAYLQKIDKQIQILWSLDLHGHSQEHGFFAYFNQQNDKNLILNHLLSSKSSLFRANKCIYQIGVNKRSSLRSQLWQRMKVQNSVTVQISLFGFYDSNKAFVQFQMSHFDEIAGALLQSLLQTEKMCSKKASKLSNMKEIIKKMKKKQWLVQEQDSDPDPQGDYLKNQEREEGLHQQRVLYEKKLSEPKIFNSKSKGLMLKSKIKTEVSKVQINPMQKIYPVKNQLIQANAFIKVPTPQQKKKFPRRQIYNLTFSNRSKSYNKNLNQSQQHQRKLKMINIGEKQEANAVESKKKKNHFVSSHQNLQKSLEMRKRIRLAFDNRLKTDRSAYMTNQLIKNSQPNRMKVFIYPQRREKQKKKQQMEQDSSKIRHKSFVTSLYSRFHNSFYLKIKDQ